MPLLIATVPLTALIVGARAGLISNGQNTILDAMITVLIPKNITAVINFITVI